MNELMIKAIFTKLDLAKSGLLRFAMVLACLLGAAMGFAQHDVALDISVDRDSVAAGDIVTWALHVSNENLTDVTGLQVRDTLLPGLTYLSHIAPAGTTYDISTGIWNINSQLNSATTDLILTIKTRVEWEGMYMNIAEVTAMNGTDVDSEPNNQELLEDDMHKACVSVPITICSQLNDSIRVTLLPMFTNIQWFKDGVLIPVNQGGTQDTFYITNAGTYAFTATQNGCPTLTCCPVVVKDSCYDLALRKTLAAGQNSTVTIGSNVFFTLEIINQGDLPAHTFSILDYVDPAYFSPFNTANNPPGVTSGTAIIPYAWAASGNDGKVTLNGTLSPGDSVTLPVTLKVLHGGQATNFAEIFSDDDRDLDSQPESQQQNGNADTYVDNETNNTGGDEDDHDGATLTILASGLGDFVWNDTDHDGQQDPGEPGVPDIIVHLYNGNGTLVATDTTDANGGYFFDDLPPGDYYVVFDVNTLPPDFFPTQPNTGNDASDSDADATGTTNLVTLGPGETNNTLDFGVELGLFDLALLKATTTTDVMLGDTVTYTITIYNQGEVTAHNVVVTDYLPDGLLFNAALNPAWSAAANGYSTQLPGTIPPGGTAAVNILLIVDPTFNGNTILNTAEISFADNDNNPNNGSPQDGDSSPDDDAVNDGFGSGQEDDIDEAPVHIIPAGEFDLSLEKMLTPGQASLVDIGDEVSYTIKITNEGTLPAYHVDVNDNIPAGLALSPNDPNWTVNGPDMVSYIFPGPLQPGQSASIEILMVVLYGASGQQINNVAEITSAEDEDGTIYTDNDSTPNNGTPGEDDLDDEVIELLPHDPTGWIYCDKTGNIIPGGHITVTGPNGIPNSQVFLLHDGSEGYYEFYTNGTPGIYTINYSHPLGFPLSPNCPPSAGPFDPTGMANPVILGADTLNADYIEDKTCAANPFYLAFEVQPGDPIILHNNLPVQCILIASVVCEDSNHNDLADAGDQPIAGATVNLYNCADPTTPIFTTVSDSLGNYRFDGLDPGSYMVGYSLTPDVRPVSDGVIDENGFSPCINLTWGQCDTTTVICLYQCPDVDAGPDMAQCNNTSNSQLNATVPYSIGSFTWSPTTGLSNPNIANPIAMPPATTTYTVTFDDGKGCVDSDAMTVQIGNLFPILSNAPFADTTVECDSPLTPFEAPIFADGCDASLDIVLDSTVVNNPCGRTIVRTWTATNDNGNSTIFTQTVNVVDNTPPVLFATHVFFGEIHHGDTLYADCTQIPSLDSLGFSAYDFCSATTHDFTETVIHGDCATDGFLENRYCGWTATDACGNTDSLYFHVIITDNLPPTLAGVPANIDMPCGQAAPPVASVTATDLCAGNLPVSFNQTQTGSGCATTITRTWSAVDACGNAVSASQIIHVSNDNQPPVLAGIPANTSATCGTIPPIPPLGVGGVTATDNCDTNVQLDFNETIAGGNCNYVMTRTWTATDDCGHVTSASQTITLTDDDAPVLVGLPAADINASCGYLPAPPNVTATDGCDPDVPVTFTETQTGNGCVFTVLRKWTASDDCGHTTSFTQTIHVVDDIGPVISVTAPGLTWLADGDTLIRQCNQVISLTSNSAVAVDACCTMPPVMTFHEYVSAGSCQTTGYIQMMTCGWIATDCCGNVDSLFFTVIVTDTIPPKLYGVPADVTLACGQTPASNLPTITAVDNCSNNLQVTMSTSTVNIPGGYVLTRTWSATDNCGNTGTKSQHITVTVTDVVPPVLANVPADLSLDCGAAIPPAANNVTASDFCDATPTITFSETNSGSASCGTITRTWTAMDDAGNSSSASQIITVTDMQAPVFVGALPQNITVECSAIPAPATLTATDNCDANVQVIFAETQTGSGCNYMLTRTWTASDDCGNQAVAHQTINVNDAQAPVFAGVLPQNITAECSAIPVPATLTATDNCDANVQIDFAETQTGSGCSYTLTRTWTAMDDCGNQTVAQQTINVEDTTPPVMFATHAFFGEIHHGDTLYADCTQIPSLDSIGFSAYDLCGATTTNFTENVGYASCPLSGFAQRRYCGWTATDACGNTDSLYFTVIIYDPLPPTLVGVPADTSIQCGALPVAPVVIATDNCSAYPTVAMVETTSGTPCDRTVTRTWTATDGCGNESVAVQNIHVADTIAPVFYGDLPQDMTVPCGALPLLGVVNALDNCDTYVEITYDQTQTGYECEFVLERTWTATDDCGNQSTHKQTITVLDTEPPYFLSNIPADTTVACDEIPAPVDILAYDNCDDYVVVNFDEVQNGTGCNYTLVRTWTAKDFCGLIASGQQTITVIDTVAPYFLGNAPADATVACGQVPAPANLLAADNCGGNVTVDFGETQSPTGVNCNYTLTRTWTAMDACGNQTIAQQIITVQDSSNLHIEFVNPLLTGLEDGASLVISCSDPSIFDASDALALEGCGGNSLIFKENGITPGNCVAAAQGGDGFIVIMHCTWVATDTCGNTASVTLHFVVVDNEPPVISNIPADITIDCGAPIPPCGTPTVSDDCGSVIMNNLVSTVATANGFDRICTWIATDGCGNSSTATSTVHVVDTGVPTLFGVPADSTIYLANGETVPPAANVTAQDGCPGQAVPVVFSETSAPMGGSDCMTKITRTWTVTNSDGTTVMESQEIIVVGFNDANVVSVLPDTCGMGVGSVTLAPADYVFNWAGGQTGAVLGNLSAGVYTVTATNPTAGGCAKVLSVTVGNVQVPLTVTAINTTPQTCTGTNGTASIAPASYNYAWSDGGTGAVRTGLAAGSYNVTATLGAAGTGGCNLVFVVNIQNGCNCVPATISSLTTTDANCGLADGSATLNMTVPPADYGFLWIPNFGISNANNNGRTELPAGHYIVLATYQGNNNCVEKFEFDIFDNCPKCAPLFNVDSMTVSMNASPSKVCIPIPYALLSQNQLQMDGVPYTGSLESCEAVKVVKYGFGALPAGQLAVRWQFAADTFYTMADGLSSVAAFLNQLDANGDWYYDKTALEFVSGNLGGNYGKLRITYLPTGEVRESNLKQAKSAMGTSLLLTTGTHQLVLNDSLMGCPDTLILTVNEAIIVVQTPPILQSDTLRTLAGKMVKGNVLANDHLNQKAEKVKIAKQPANGEAWVNVDNTVSYRPLIEYCNSYKNMPPDGFTYEVCFEDGSKGQASVTVFVDCVDDIAPVQEIVLYPNPATRFVNLDLSPLAGQSADVVVYNDLGVRMTSIHVESIETIPLRIELAGYPAGHYVVQVKSAGNKPIVRKFIVAGH